MKIINKIIIIIILLLNCNNVKSQNILDMSNTDYFDMYGGVNYLKDINHYLDNFVGTWTYINGNKKFELKLEKVEEYHEVTNFTGVVNQDYYTDCIKITYKQYENNILVFQSPANEIKNSGTTKDGILLTGSFTDFNRVSYFACFGCQKAPVGNIITALNFKISPFNSNVASFKLKKYHLGGYNYDLYQGQPLFSVPNEVELTKN